MIPAKRLVAWLGFFFGLVLFILILARQGAGDVFEAVALAGWGVVVVALSHLSVVATDALSLSALLGRRGRQSFLRLAWVWWLGAAVNDLLPVAQVGGELVRARLLARGGVPGPLAGATVVVGLTASLLTLLVFAVAGGGLLGVVAGVGGGAVALSLIAGLAVLGGLLLGFYLAQRGGLFRRLAGWFERLASGEDWFALVGGAEDLDRAIVCLYRRRGAFLACCAWRLVAWFAGAAEVWIALHFLGHPVTFAEAIVLESLGQVIKSAGFAIPGALGVQEGGFLVLGALIGLPGEAALGLSLIKRVRDLLLGLPGLAAWQFAEGTGLLRRRAGER